MRPWVQLILLYIDLILQFESIYSFSLSPTANDKKSIVFSNDDVSIDSQQFLSIQRVRQFKPQPAMRSLHTHAGKEMAYHRVELNVRTVSSIQIESLQYLVRVAPESRSDVLSFLQQHSSFVQYIPHDTFMVLLGHSDLPQVSKLEGVVEILHVPVRMKMRDDLFEVDQAPAYSGDIIASDMPGHEGESESCEDTSLHALLVDTADHMLLEDFQSLCLDRTSNTVICNVSLSETGKKLVVQTDSCLKKRVARIIASHAAVTWVEERLKIMLRNKFATRVVQSHGGDSRPLWENGMLGSGEVSRQFHLFQISLSDCSHFFFKLRGADS
jgi:hypothetical protein